MSEFSMEGKFLILDNTGFIVENNSSLNSLNKRHVSRKCSVDLIPVTRELKNVIFGQNRDELKSSWVLGRDEFFHHVFKP